MPFICALRARRDCQPAAVGRGLISISRLFKPINFHKIQKAALPPCRPKMRKVCSVRSLKRQHSLATDSDAVADLAHSFIR